MAPLAAAVAPSEIGAQLRVVAAADNQGTETVDYPDQQKHADGGRWPATSMPSSRSKATTAGDGAASDWSRPSGSVVETTVARQRKYAAARTSLRPR